jgi:HAMP domain-containing protein
MDKPTGHREETDSRPWWWIFDPRESLRAAAALFFGLGGVLFTVLLASIAGRTLQQNLEQHLGNTYETLAVQLSDKIDRAIYERYRTLQLTAGLALLRNPETAPADRRQALTATQDATPEFAWLGFAEPSGRIVVATKGHLEGTSAEMRAWFRSAQEQPYAGNLREVPEIAALAAGADEGEVAPRYLTFAVPVPTPDGRLAGVLGAYLRWTWARELQASVLSDAARRDRVGATVYSGTGDVLLDSGSSGWTHPPDLPAVPARKFRGYQIEPTSLGTTYLTGFVRSRGFREYRGLGWIAVVRQPVDQAFRPVVELRHTVARWGFAFTGAAMLGAWLYAGRLSRRLRSVGLAAHRIRTGDVLTILPSARGEGEIARMCSALNRLVEDFRARLK